MVGAGETFLPAFALACGAGALSAGLIAAIPFLIGSLLQLAGPTLIERVGSYRRWLVGLSFLQSFGFAALAVLAALNLKPNEFVLYAIASLYWCCNLASTPAWNSWITQLVPSPIRQTYFAKRSHFGQVGLVVGLVGGGLILHGSRASGQEMRAFAALFAIAGLTRIASAFSIRLKHESPAMLKAQRKLPMRVTARRLRKGPTGALFRFLLIFAFAVNFASPYFNPFLLQDLHLTYGSYMVLIAASYVAKIAVFALLGRTRVKRCPWRLMRFGMIGGSLIPLLFCLSRGFTFLLFAHVASGAVWAMYEMGLMLNLFGAVRDEERTSVLSLYNFLSAVMIVFGTLAGGQVMKWLGESSATYYVIFSISCAARLLSLIAFDRAARIRDNVSVESALEVARVPEEWRAKSENEKGDSSLTA